MRQKIENIWAIAGKIGVIIGLLVGFVTLLAYFGKLKEYKVVGKIDYHYSEMPTKLVEKYISDYDSNSDTKQIEASMSGIILDSKTTDRFSQYMVSSFNKNTLKEISDIDTYFEFDIQNKGKKVAISLRLDTEMKGFYQLDNNGDNSILPFNRVIKIGDLNPGSKLKIRVWSNDFYAGRSAIIDLKIYGKTEDIAISYQDGIVSLSTPITISGVWASIFRNSNFALPILLAIITSIPITYLVTNLIKTITKKTPKKRTIRKNKSKSTK